MPDQESSDNMMYYPLWSLQKVNEMVSFTDKRTKRDYMTGPRYQGQERVKIHTQALLVSKPVFSLSCFTAIIPGLCGCPGPYKNLRKGEKRNVVYDFKENF